jgi:hypothetical protein
MKRKPSGKKEPFDHEVLFESVKKVLKISQNQRCFEALRRLLRAWPVYSALIVEYEELLDSLKSLRTTERMELAPEAPNTQELKSLNALIYRMERSFNRS